jgi:hypothetical protein
MYMPLHLSKLAASILFAMHHARTQALDTSRRKILPASGRAERAARENCRCGTTTRQMIAARSLSPSPTPRFPISPELPPPAGSLGSVSFGGRRAFPPIARWLIVFRGKRNALAIARRCVSLQARRFDD